MRGVREDREGVRLVLVRNLSPSTCCIGFPESGRVLRRNQDNVCKMFQGRSVNKLLIKIHNHYSWLKFALQFRLFGNIFRCHDIRF